MTTFDQAMRYACEMLTDAELLGTSDERAALAADIAAVRDELAKSDEFMTMRDGMIELRRRIGGSRNLRSYLDCLMVQR